MKRAYVFLAVLLAAVSVHASEDKSKIQLETTRIKANKELPQVLYIVPWKDFELSGSEDYKIKLHDLFGDLYDPLLASGPTDKKKRSR